MSWTKRYTGTEPIRVNKWLAAEGVCSRREADALIAAGQITIEGAVVTDMGHRIAPGETAALTQGAAKSLGAQLSIVINKPVGLVSGTPEPGEIPAVRLLTAENRHGSAMRPPGREARLAPLGRLDKDSRGLLILSEDGVLAKALIGPDSRTEKEYRVRVSGDITPEKIARLRHGLELDGRQLRPARVSKTGPQSLCFILTEGRKRQIRRMCDLVELRVNDLQRVRIGSLTLGDLPEGRWRPLTEAERSGLMAAPRPPKSRPAKPIPGRPPREERARKPVETKAGTPKASPLKGEKFRRTKLAPRPRTPIR
jgi:23S rRNA pseudouridine2604 synthase